MKERLWWFKASRKNLVVERENLLLEGENLMVEGETLVLEGEELQRHWQLVGFGSPATAASRITQTLQTLIVPMSDTQ